jgi:hypothetical protein
MAQNRDMISKAFVMINISKKQQLELLLSSLKSWAAKLMP